MHLCQQVLSVLVRAVTKNIADASGESASCLRPKLLKLFGHITAKVTSSADVWRLYAELLATSEPLTATLHERVRRNCVLYCLLEKLFVFCFHICLRFSNNNNNNNKQVCIAP